jgi:Flp pilus assembly protein TadD
MSSISEEKPIRATDSSEQSVLIPNTNDKPLHEEEPLANEESYSKAKNDDNSVSGPLSKQTSERVDKHDPTEAEALNVKGMNFVRARQLESALDCFEQAVKLNPNHSRAWYNRGMSLMGLGESNEEALHCFQKAIEIDPLYAEAWNNQGAVLTMLDRKNDALTSYERAIELKKGYAMAWQNKGLLLLKMGDKKAAKECVKNANEAGLK